MLQIRRHKHHDHILDGHAKAHARAKSKWLHMVKCALAVHIEMVNLGAGLEDTRQRTCKNTLLRGT